MEESISIEILTDSDNEGKLIGPFRRNPAVYADLPGSSSDHHVLPNVVSKAAPKGVPETSGYTTKGRTKGRGGSPPSILPKAKSHILVFQSKDGHGTHSKGQGNFIIRPNSKGTITLLYAHIHERDMHLFNGDTFVFTEDVGADMSFILGPGIMPDHVPACLQVGMRKCSQKYGKGIKYKVKRTQDNRLTFDTRNAHTVLRIEVEKFSRGLPYKLGLGGRPNYCSTGTVTTAGEPMRTIPSTVCLIDLGSKIAASRIMHTGGVLAGHFYVPVPWSPTIGAQTIQFATDDSGIFSLDYRLIDLDTLLSIGATDNWTMVIRLDLDT